MEKDVSPELNPDFSGDAKKQLKYSRYKKKGIEAIVCLLVAIALFYSPGLKFPVIDKDTDTFFSGAIKQASIAYAACRILNATVSVVKDSDVTITPAGLGLSIAIGQFLDPIDDMTERASDILVTSITSLGVQKLAYEITVLLAPSMIAGLLVLSSVLIWFENKKIISTQKTLMKIILLLIIARLALPVSAIANNYLQKNIFEDRISEIKMKLDLASEELDKLRDFSLPKIDGFKGTIKNSKLFIQKKGSDLRNTFYYAYNHRGEIIKNLLAISFLYVSVFIIQVIVIPLLSFWTLVKITNNLFNSNIPVIVHHSKGSNK